MIQCCEMTVQGPLLQNGSMACSEMHILLLKIIIHWNAKSAPAHTDESRCTNTEELCLKVACRLIGVA